MPSVQFAVRLESVANARESWPKRARRSKEHRLLGALFARSSLGARPLGSTTTRWRVTITRVAPRAFDDDNLRGACKALRDGIADAFGVPDSDPRIAWHYGQRRGRPREHAVEIEIVRDVECTMEVTKML